ncbi:Probable deferrochelatase/peroxidase YfeX [Kingella potus]|uniref:Probable deferrochelatase/peroxidase YfeX n=1 Tax=Kingella potus TaxID=265175 RepID=A0A377QYA3_9NEIS|nr:Dyp-type peroxidase [Kingella potus]STR00213.1 Probable deferrochelatase/peroxidase YfeX [Kingella potus]
MTPQTAIIPDTITAAVYIEANVRGQEAVKAACRAALAALDGCRRRFPGHELGMTIAFGADFWHSLGHKNEGREIRPFVPLGNGLCPATQCDLMIHIQSKHGGLNYLLAEQVLAAFGSAIDVQNETHGFRMPEERGLDGFVDGTENPHGAEAVAAVAAIAAGADAGGSYVVLQQYLHDLAKWSRLSLAEQEQSVGRSKEENIEFPRAERLPDSHLGRTNIKENGAGLKIVRRSLPFGKVSGEHGLQFIAYCATLHNIDEQLKFMFGDKDGKTDLLLQHMSRAVRSAYYYAPGVERLADL